MIHPQPIFIGRIEPKSSGTFVKTPARTEVSGLVHYQDGQHSVPESCLFSRDLPEKFVEPRIVRFEIERFNFLYQFRVRIVFWPRAQSTRTVLISSFAAFQIFAG